MAFNICRPIVESQEYELLFNFTFYLFTISGSLVLFSFLLPHLFPSFVHISLFLLLFIRYFPTTFSLIFSIPASIFTKSVIFLPSSHFFLFYSSLAIHLITKFQFIYLLVSLFHFNRSVFLLLYFSLLYLQTFTV